MRTEPGTGSSLSDNELVERCLAGEEWAWRELITRYQRLIYSVARTFCPNVEDSADVFQYTCLDLYKGLPNLRDVQALPAWLITVTRRRALSLLRANPQVKAIDNLESSSAAAIQAIELEHSIERALNQISARCRELIDLLYFDIRQPSYAEISGLLGIPVPSIGPTRARCLEKLRKFLT